MKTPFICFITFLFLFACKKEPISSPTEPSQPLNEKAEDYSQLKIGNYWVYQRFNVDLETGEVSETNQMDSLYVKNEMIVDGKIYHQLKGTWFGLEYSRLVRNEGEQLISPEGKVFFSTINLPDTLEVFRENTNQFIDSSFTLLLNENVAIETPAGDFESTFQFENRFFLNASLSHEFLTRKDTEFYSKGIGVVKYTSFYLGPVDLEMRLIRTNVE